MKILLVEDSKFMRLATERALVRAGYEVSTAIDGEQALQMAREGLPELILLGYVTAKDDWAGRASRSQEGSGNGGDPGDSVHRAFAEKCYAAACRRSLRFSGEVFAGPGYGTGSATGGAGRDRKANSQKASVPDPGCGRPKMSAAPGITCHDLRFSSSRSSGEVTFGPQDTWVSCHLAACWPWPSMKINHLRAGTLNRCTESMLSEVLLPPDLANRPAQMNIQRAMGWKIL